MRVAINGFGRIGRSVYRILHYRDDINVVAINDLYDQKALAYLLQYDTIMLKFPEKVSTEDGYLTTSRDRVKMLCERNPAALPWGDLGIDVIIESPSIGTNLRPITMALIRLMAHIHFNLTCPQDAHLPGPGARLNKA